MRLTIVNLLENFFAKRSFRHVLNIPVSSFEFEARKILGNSRLRLGADASSHSDIKNTPLLGASPL
jgi:hypothetical protein